MDVTVICRVAIVYHMLVCICLFTGVYSPTHPPSPTALPVIHTLLTPRSDVNWLESGV